MLTDFITSLIPMMDGYTELRAHEERSYMLSCDRDQGVQLVENKSSGGVCSRALRDGVYGFAASDIYTKAEAERVLKLAESNARTLSLYARRKMAAIPDMPNTFIAMNNIVRPFNLALYKDMLEECDRYARTRYPEYEAFFHMNFTTSEKLLAVHSGASGRSLITLGMFSADLSRDNADGANEHGSKMVGFDVYPEAWFDCAKKLYAVIDEAYADLQANKKADTDELVMPKAGPQVCILTPEFTGMLAHEAVGHTCEADSVLRKGSVAAKFMGTQVASPLVSLTDFAQEAYGTHCPIEMYLDDEGTVCKDAPIIKDGILVGCMTNRDAAERLGVENTGNARASQYSDEPIIRMRNTCFHKGTSTLDEMIASVERGYYLVRSGGGNGSEKGEFNMNIGEGFEIVDGKLGRRIKPTMVSGLAWDALKTVSMVSNEFVNMKNTGMCGKKQSIPTSQGGAHMKLIMNMGGK